MINKRNGKVTAIVVKDHTYPVLEKGDGTITWGEGKTRVRSTRLRSVWEAVPHREFANVEEAEKYFSTLQ